jgi:acetate kinase
MLNKNSGLKGICKTNDMREVLSNVKSNDKSAKLALEMYIYRIKKYIGAYTVALGHIDGIVFTGGIAEHSAEVRELICKDLYDSIGVEMDISKNSNSNVEIQSKRSRIKLFVIPTNEELEIALQVEAVVQ